MFHVLGVWRYEAASLVVLLVAGSSSRLLRPEPVSLIKKKKSKLRTLHASLYRSRHQIKVKGTRSILDDRFDDRSPTDSEHKYI